MENDKFQELVIEKFTQMDAAQKILIDSVGEVKHRIDGLDQRIDGLENNVKGLVQSVDGLNQRVGALEETVSDTNRKFDRLAIRMENEVIDKIKILFDAHSVQVDHYESLKEGQIRLEKNLDSLNRIGMKFDLRLKKQEREIQLLREDKIRALV